MKKIKTFYKNLRIKYKMFLLIVIVLTAFSVGGLSILQYIFHVYNDEFYRQSAQSLNVSAMSIENELRKMERVSYQVATDLSIQNYLLSLKRSDDHFDKFITGTNIRKRLLQLGALNKYVNSIQVYDYDDAEYKAGNRMITLSEHSLEKIKSRARIKEGGAEWLFSNENDNSLVVTREVRYYNTLSLESIGYIVIRINLDEIISDLTGEVKTNLIVMNEDGELIYFPNNDFPVEELTAMVENNLLHKKNNDDKNYGIFEIEKKQYFATYLPAQYLNWTYVIVSPYSDLFKAIVTTRKAVIFIYVVLFIFTIFLGIKFTRNITNPIESLNQKMQSVQSGSLNHFKHESYENYAKDELGEMHRNFQSMMNQIQALIRENYQKQIAIKDAELKTLQAQINPHFLYNTLDSINWAAKISGQKKISEMAEALGYLLRTSINIKESLITIEDELAIVKRYITIQAYRFEERLNFEMNIDEKIKHCKVPKFVLQPLIENSIQHGLQQMIDVCNIRVDGYIKDEKIVLSVEDNGPGMDEQIVKKLENASYEAKGMGFGLKNIKERIELLFGDHYGMKIESEKDKGTKVFLFLPYEG